jgi:putative tryptophan/tyrosine transport system substrate-binding protein
VRRREFISLLGGAAAAWPLAARAQQGERVRRIAVLLGTTDDPEGQARVTALKQGLQELGWTEGRNIQIETRFSGADIGRIRADAAQLVALAPDVIVAQSTPVIRALRPATSSIPIVFAAINDPVDQGFVSSLARPGGNITGLALIEFTMVGKWLELLKEAVPGVVRAALMSSTPTRPPTITSICVRSKLRRGQSQSRYRQPPFATHPKSKALLPNWLATRAAV